MSLLEACYGPSDDQPAPKIKYVYCWVRKDLPHAYQIIQAGHALHEMGMDTERPFVVPSPPADRMPVHLILFGVSNQKELLEASRYLNEHGIDHHTFFESDYDTGFTAIATELFDYECPRRELLKRFRMY